ncbi:hypothetical protein PoB_004976900 [Plakobranchus ocellatus]|uniref:Uncharacterized protein n=1 Tax=Plakobranchus ocellatus TaxID=259542 RepID=A0AAV4BXY4_9GAST|nr:hypothetical protein PoB_004976900 [Plakobranchus ocellatus]
MASPQQVEFRLSCPPSSQGARRRGSNLRQQGLWKCATTKPRKQSRTGYESLERRIKWVMERGGERGGQGLLAEGAGENAETPALLSRSFLESSSEYHVPWSWGIGGTVANKSALRSAGILRSQARASQPAPWPDGRPESLR